MKLSPHFSLLEMCLTKTGLPNTPSPHAVESLRDLATLVLEPWRERVGPLIVSSGYRSPPVNVAVGGSKTSDHVHGRAADVVPAMALPDAWAALLELVDDGLPVDQAILYVRAPGRGWVHVSHRSTPRRELLVNPASGGYLPWVGYPGALVLP